MRDLLLAGIHREIAELKLVAHRETDPVKLDRMMRHARSREDYAEEEADAITADIAGNEQPH